MNLWRFIIPWPWRPLSSGLKSLVSWENIAIPRVREFRMNLHILRKLLGFLLMRAMLSLGAPVDRRRLSWPWSNGSFPSFWASWGQSSSWSGFRPFWLYSLFPSAESLIWPWIYLNITKVDLSLIQVREFLRTEGCELMLLLPLSAWRNVIWVLAVCASSHWSMHIVPWPNGARSSYSSIV